MIKYLCDPPAPVKILLNEYQWNSKTDKILITFDDGPNPRTTCKILEFLSNNDLKAAFFCVGNNIVKYPNLVEDIISEGHLIGNHTFHHSNVTAVSKQNYYNEIENFNYTLMDRFNYTVKYFRPPHGRVKLGMNKMLKSKGLRNIMWSLLTYDYRADDNLAGKIIEKYLNKDSIVVFHDSVKSETVITTLLEKLLKCSEQKNFKFGNPGECLK